MPKARPVDFEEEFRMLEGEGVGVKEQRIEPLEISGNSISPLDFDTVVRHLRRNGYDVEVSPNGGSRDVTGDDEVKNFDISELNDQAYQVRFSMDIGEAERRRDEQISNPEAYVESVYSQIVDELVEREGNLERASQSYVSKVFEQDDPVGQIESDFMKHGDDAGEIIDSYFGDMRPSELALAYAVHFELHKGESVDNERRNLPGKMPLHDALRDEDARDRDSMYFGRYLEKVLQKAGERTELTDELKQYAQDLH